MINHRTGELYYRTSAKAKIDVPFILFIISLLITLVVGSESYLQYNSPRNSLLSFFHNYNLLTEYKVIYEPNKGIWHGIGWAGTFLMVIMHVYSIRKKAVFMHEWGMLRHWLDFHIFCGVTGPILITFHTTFKLGGIISISYWSVVAVALSGLFGRYIFGLIPRSIAGNELKIEEIEELNTRISGRIKSFYLRARNLDTLLEKSITIPDRRDEKLGRSIIYLLKDKYRGFLETGKLNRVLKEHVRLAKKDRIELIKIIKQKLEHNRRMHFLNSAHSLLMYWHRIHIIFTVIIYLIALLHIIVYYLFRVGR